MDWKRVEALFQHALDLEPPERAAYVQSEVKDDSDVCEEVSRLLKLHDGQVDDFLETPALPPRPQAFADHLPEQVGDYRVIRELGRGGMGVVYEAEQQSPRRIVALKVMRPGLAPQHMLRRFKQEAQVLGHLQHPGIAHIYEAGTARNDQPFFAMELIRGEALSAHIANSRPTTNETLHLVAQVCDAVHHAHQRGIVHRDLKPGNILVDEAGDPRILDFGIARLTESDVQMTTVHTDMGQIMGTVPYMSPEQVAGDSTALDTRSDVYAIGVILYEALSGALPHDLREKSIPEAVRLITEGEPSRLSSANIAFRGDIETMVGKALEKDKDRRYGSAAEFAADIRRYLKDEPVVARPASTMYQFRKFAKRNKMLVVATSILMVALIGGLIGMTVLRSRETLQRERAERRFEEVRELTKALLFDFHDQIADLPGALDARKNLVYTGFKFVRILSEEAVDDPRLSREVAAAYGVLGDLQGKPHGTNLGDLPGAMDSYRKGVALLEAVLERAPDNHGVMNELIGHLESIAQVQLAMGKVPDAVATFERIGQLLDRALAISPSESKLLSQRAGHSADLGRLMARVGRSEDALRLFRIYEEHVIAEIEADPRPHLQANLCIIKSAMGDLHYDKRHYQLALDQQLEAHKIAERLVREFPDNARFQGVLANMHIDVAAALAGLKRSNEAHDHYRASSEIWQKLLEADPDDIRARRALANTYFGIGYAHEAAEEYADALSVYENYLDEIRKVSAANPESAVYRRDLGLAHDRVAGMQAALDQLNSAIENQKEAVVRFAALLENDPKSVQLQRDLAHARRDLGAYYAERASAEESPPRSTRGPVVGGAAREFHGA